MGHQASAYSTTAIVLHWAIAAAIIGNFAIGWWMHHAIDVPETQARAVNAYQLHKSIGLSILLLSLMRLGWRLLHRPPPLPAGMPAWERWAAQSTHWLFYLLMLGIPLSGWLYVSTQWHGDKALNVPTLWFGLFEVPHLFGLADTAPALRQSLSAQTGTVHEYLAKGAMLLLIVHVAAALKHQFVNRDEVLGHMIPLFAQQHRRSPGLWLGMGLILLALAAAAWELLSPADRLQGTNASAAISSEGNWQIDPAASKIGFSGLHAGRAFAGEFKRWHASLRLDPENMQASRISVMVETASATDGVRLHDRSLPEKEWFDVANHPQAMFEVTGIRPGDNNSYTVSGRLSIKGNTVALAPFSLEINADQARFRGQVKIDRAELDLGMESDPGGEWVSRQISIEVDALARPAQ